MKLGMDDTPADVYCAQARSWLAKPFAERMRLGLEACGVGLRAAASLLPGDDPAALFLSLHAGAFDAEERQRVAEAIRTWHSARACAKQFSGTS
jgi:hypothetical protein